jgi:dimethylaniline monooxygenase (N-oxide forming)
VHRWNITLKDEQGERNEVFERVLVTTGPFGTPYTPKVPGMNDFKGEIMHAQAYKG